MSLIRAPWTTRALGWWMVGLGLAAPVVIVIDSATSGGSSVAAGVIVSVVFGVFAVWLGYWTATMGVSADDDVITVRNQMHTHRLPKGDIASVEIRRKLAVWALGSQVVGFIVTGERDVIVEATRSLSSPHGRLFTQSKEATHTQMSLLAQHLGVALNDLPTRGQPERT